MNQNRARKGIPSESERGENALIALSANIMAIPNRSSGKPILTKSSPLSVAGTKRWNQSTGAVSKGYGVVLKFCDLDLVQGGLWPRGNIYRTIYSLWGHLMTAHTNRIDFVQHGEGGLYQKFNARKKAGSSKPGQGDQVLEWVSGNLGVAVKNLISNACNSLEIARDLSTSINLSTIPV